jgi:multiple sugar transport system substrate-binding protein
MKNPNFLNQLSGLLQRIRPTTHKLTVPLFTVALGLSVTLYACQSSAQREITLCFAVPGGEIREITDWEQLTKKFNNDNEGKIKIELNPSTPEKLKGNYSRSLKELSAKTKNTKCSNEKDIRYDLVYTDIIWVPEFAQYLLPLDKHFKEGELQDFLKTEIDNGKYKSKLYRIPFRTDVGVLYYNKDLLGKEKVPTTFKDLLDIAIKIKAKKERKIQYLWQADEEGLVAMFVEVLDYYSGFWIKENNEVGLHKDEAIKAVEFLRKTIKQEISFSLGDTQTSNSDEQLAKKKFLKGNSAFLRSWPGVWAEAQNPENQDSEVQGRIGIAPVIGGKGCHGGWGLAIAKNIDKERQEAAIKAVKFLTSRESQLLFTLSHGSVPTRKDLFFDPLIVSRYSHYPELFKMVNKTVSRPRLARYERVSNILQKSLQKAFNTETKNNEVESIMKTASEDTKKCLNNETQCGN